MRYKWWQYRITIERGLKMKEWRGVKPPFNLRVRLHYPTGNRIWFNIIGPDAFQWCKQKHFEWIQKRAKDEASSRISD